MMSRSAVAGIALVLTLALTSGVALADADCPAAPKDTWLSEADMKKKVADMGYKHDVFKVSGNCYGSPPCRPISLEIQSAARRAVGRSRLDLDMRR